MTETETSSGPAVNSTIENHPYLSRDALSQLNIRRGRHNRDFHLSSEAPRSLIALGIGEQNFDLEVLNSIREVDFNATRKEVLELVAEHVKMQKGQFGEVTTSFSTGSRGIGGFTERVYEIIEFRSSELVPAAPSWRDMFIGKQYERPVYCTLTRILGDMDQADLRRWNRRDIADCADLVEYPGGENSLKYRPEIFHPKFAGYFDGNQSLAKHLIGAEDFARLNFAP